MRTKELVSYVRQRYQKGNKIRLAYCNDCGIVIKTFTAKIKDFYPGFILLEHKGINEGITYWELWKYGKRVS